MYTKAWKKFQSIHLCTNRLDLPQVAWDAVREDEERIGRSQQRVSTSGQCLGNEDDVPALPPPVSFLKAGELVGLHGGVAKKGPSIMSPFRNRLLVLTGRRLLYFSQRGGAPGVIWLTRDSVRAYYLVACVVLDISTTVLCGLLLCRRARIQKTCFEIKDMF